MTCTKVVTGKFIQGYDSTCLYQGDFLELDKDLQYVRHARISVMPDKVCLAALKDGLEGLELEEQGKNWLEISRSCVNIDLVRNSPYTFNLSGKHPEHESSIYQLCDQVDTWPKFLQSFDLTDRLHANTDSKTGRVLPKVTFCEENMDDYLSDSESECSTLSESSSADDLGLPRCITLFGRGQGLGAMSTFNINNAMMMMNPGHVRRLTRGREHRHSIDLFGLPTDSSESIRHSNSYPQLNFSSKTERTRSLPNSIDLDNVLLDDDLRFRNRPKREAHDDMRGKTKSGVKNALNFHSTLRYRTEFGKQHAASNRELFLNERIGRLIAQPSSIKFNYSARNTNEKNAEDVGENIIPDSFETIKASEPSKTRTYEVIDSPGGKFKLSFKKFWKRREKLGKLPSKSESPGQNESEPDQVVFVNKMAVDYKSNVSSMPSFAVTSERRGAFGSDLSGKRESVAVSSVTKQHKDAPSPTGFIVKDKIKVPPPTSPAFTGKDTIRKKIVKRILSPITILRAVSEEEKNVIDIPHIENSVYQTKSNESLYNNHPKKLLDMNPNYLAHELTLIDKELLIRIPWSELSTCGWMNKEKYLRSPNVMSMVEFFNRIALVVASEILFEVDPIMRVRVISKVIQVANKLRSIGNFNSLKALLGGLQCTPIYRLKETWKEVSSKRKKNFRDLSKLMSEEDNFAAYRQELNSFMSQGSPCLPFLGDFLTQIAQTQTYLACRGKKTPNSPKKRSSSNESEGNGCSTPRPTQLNLNEKQSPTRETRPRIGLIRRRPGPSREKDVRFSKSSPNLTASCIRTPERTPHYRMNRFRRCRSWQHSNDSGIQVNNSDASSLSASSNSFQTSNTSLGSGSFAFHSRSGVSDERFFHTPKQHRELDRSSSTSTPLSIKNSVKAKLRRNRSVSEKCLSASESGTSLRTRLSFLRSFRRSKSMDQTPSSESIQKLYSTKLENGGSPGKVPSETKGTPKRKNSDEDTSDESGTELQLWHFHMAAIQYNYPSREHIKQFLLSTPFNTEEDNYKLSLQRESPARKKPDTTVS